MAVVAQPRNVRRIESAAGQTAAFEKSHVPAAGLDRFVTTAAIGVKAPEIGAAICERLSYAGIENDQARDRRHARDVSA